MTINQRVKEFIEYKGINNSQLGRTILTSRGDVSNWFNEKQIEIPPKKVLEIIRIHKDLNARWLITGEGEMLEGVKMMPGEEDLTEFGGILLDRLMDEKEKVGALKKEVEFLKAEIDHLRDGGTGRGQSHPKARAG